MGSAPHRKLAPMVDRPPHFPSLPVVVVVVVRQYQARRPMAAMADQAAAAVVFPPLRGLVALGCPGLHGRGTMAQQARLEFVAAAAAALVPLLLARQAALVKPYGERRMQPADLVVRHRQEFRDQMEPQTLATVAAVVIILLPQNLEGMADPAL